MEQAGIAADVAKLTSLEAHFARRGHRGGRQGCYREIDQEINLGSPKQLQTVLFDELGMPKTKRTKTGYTTDADALADLLHQDRAPVPAAPAAAPRRVRAAADRRGR